MSIRARLAAPAVVLATLALNGCGGSDSSAVEDPPAAGPSSTARSAPPSGIATEPNPQSSTSQVSEPETAGRPLPVGFPVDEIPVVKGAVIDGAPGDPGSPVAFSLLIRVAGESPAAAMQRITRLLEGAGFSATPGVGTPKTATSTFTTPTYDVGVNVIKADGELTASYVVVRKNG